MNNLGASNIPISRIAHGILRNSGVSGFSEPRPWNLSLILRSWLEASFQIGAVPFWVPTGFGRRVLIQRPTIVLQWRT